MPDTENCGRIPRKIPKIWSAEVVVGVMAAFCSLSVAYYNPAITNVIYLYLHKRQVLKR